MTFRFWRGRVFLRLSILFDRLSWKTMQAAKRDFARSAPLPLFDREER